ncbi:MAG: HlyC/CorC family transporter [Oscillospiraceae bacterium]|nr:HlyC/CorC family transporter [Oscillospiraceae bacterium]
MILLIVLSAFFSSSEMAITSFNRMRLKNKAEDGNKKATRALELANNFDKTISSILIGNTIVNLATTSIVTVLFIDMFGSSVGPLIATIFISVVVLIFGEILPKSYAKEKADSYVMKASGVLSFFVMILNPITILFLWLRQLMNKFLNNENKTEDGMTEAELKCMIDEIEHQGGLEKDESELVQMALDFDEITVEEILTPRVDMIAIEINESIENIQKILMSEKFSRIPVYDKTIDNIVGILLEREFFKSKVLTNDFNIKENIQKPLFVPQWMKISDVLKELQRKKTHMAIVADEHGGTMGLVTMEDLLEELVGEIWDEYDEVEQNIIKIDDQTYEVEGSMNIKSMMEYLDFSTKHFEPEGNTVGGWVMAQLHKISKKGDSFEYKNMTVTIKEIVDQRVTKVIVKIKPIEIEPEK